MAEELPELVVPDVAAWREWLRANAGSRGVWLRLAKKGGTDPTSLTYDEALDEALCEGWIDGQLRRHDAATYAQRFTPRRARSGWSERNRDLVARLTAEGRMRPAGLAQVERARADGRWDAAYARQSDIAVPDDLAAALAASPAATAMFAVLTKQNRFAVLYRIHTAKRTATREARIRAFIEQLEQRRTPYPQRALPTDRGGPASG